MGGKMRKDEEEKMYISISFLALEQLSICSIKYGFFVIRNKFQKL